VTQRIEVVRLLRGSAPLLASMAVASALWFPTTALLTRWLPLSPAGQDMVQVVAGILFLTVGMVLIAAAYERRAMTVRRVAEGLENQLIERDEALLREVEQRARDDERWHGCEQKLRDLADLASDGLWDAGPQLTLQHASPRFAEAVGLPEDQLAGRPLADLIDDPSGRLFTRMIPDRLIIRGLPVILRRPSGDGLALLSGRPTYTLSGLYSGYRGTLLDITARQAERAATEQAMQRLETALAIAGAAVVAIDADGVVTFNNSEAAQLLGWEPDQLAGRSFAVAIKGGEALAGDLMKRDRVARNGETFHRRDGSVLPVDYVCAPLQHGHALTGAVVTFRGVTERLRNERELLAAKDRAERATQAKSEFLAKMSHELRTPLSAIMGFSDLMLGELFGPIGNERYREYVGDIRQSSEHLQAIIDDVLDLSRIESGHLKLVEKPVDVAVAVEEALVMARTAASRCAVAVSNNVPGNLPRVRADDRRLRQVLLNLLSNAVKFTSEGGRVDITAEITGDGALILRVTDTGIGIPPEDLPNITQVFVQGNLAVARNHAGAGLGLPLAKHLVELHGGQLTIDSAVQIGTTVTVWLPPSRLVTESDPVPGGAPQPTYSA